jgi:hypothetical protein
MNRYPPSGTAIPDVVPEPGIIPCVWHSRKLREKPWYTHLVASPYPPFIKDQRAKRSVKK